MLEGSFSHKTWDGSMSYGYSCSNGDSGLFDCDTRGQTPCVVVRAPKTIKLLIWKLCYKRAYSSGDTNDIRNKRKFWHRIIREKSTAKTDQNNLSEYSYPSSEVIKCHSIPRKSLLKAYLLYAEHAQLCYVL